MDRAVLSGDKVVVTSVVVREVNGETTSIDEGHATCFLLADSASVDILLIRVSLALELL